MRWAIFVAAIALPVCLIAELRPIHAYSTDDGLASNSIGKVVADSRGFVWFCTPEGLSRFDGYRFVNFGVAEGLPHRSVKALLETRTGEYLVGTVRGLSQFQAAGGGKFTTYLPGHNAEENAVNALLQDSRGRIWCGTRAGLFELVSGHRFRRQPLPPPPGQERIPVASLMEDAGHRLWVATRLGIYVIGADGAAQHVAMPGTTRNVRALLQDRYGRIWAALQGGLVLMRDADKDGRYAVQRIYREAGEVKGLDVTSLAEGPDGYLWAGASAGIVRWLPGSPSPALRMLTRAQGLIDRQVNALARDRAGNMWAGTEAAGAMKILQAGFTTFREADGLTTDRVWAISTDRTGTIMALAASVSGNESLNLFDGARFHASLVKGFSKEATWGHHVLLQARTGAWWTATTAGLCTYAPTPGGTPPGGQPTACYARDQGMFQLFEDSKGGIWASSQVLPAGDVRLIRWDPATNDVSFAKGGPSGKEPVSAFAEDRDGNIWMALAGDLFRYNGRQFTQFTPKDGVPADINDLFVDRGGRLWIASENGLGAIDRPGSPHFGLRIYKTSDGLSSDAIICLTEDSTGRIYAATVKGVDRLDPRTGYIKHFSVADGLARGNITMASRDGAGDLWFATTQGLSRLSPTADRPPAIPSVRITDLRIGRDRYPVSQLGETRIRRGDLQPSQNQVQVAFVGFSDEPEANLRYLYTLEGGESGWQGPGRDHEANYPGLEPGSYHFLVKAVNSEGQESETPAEIDFAIMPPVWGRWWFRLSALLACGALLYGAYRYNLNRLLELERVRTRIATDLHDDIGSSLTQIAILAEVARREVRGANQRAVEPMARVADLSRDLVDAMSEIVWAINPHKDHLRDLIQRMRRFANDVLAPREIEFTFRAPDLAHDARLGADTRRQVFLVFKEALHNVARHARCRTTEISLTMEKAGLVLSISDDGQGFDMSHSVNGEPAGHGLASMTDRAKRLGGALEVQTRPGAGTRITLRVPLDGRTIRSGKTTTQTGGDTTARHAAN
ncbi:MAG: two-component regulator propeller domain-containing protein [Bryobacteraceae bacterium]